MFIIGFFNISECFIGETAVLRYRFIFDHGTTVHFAVVFFRFIPKFFA
jgi:hypothetical protein